MTNFSNAQSQGDRDAALMKESQAAVDRAKRPPSFKLKTIRFSKHWLAVSLTSFMAAVGLLYFLGGLFVGIFLTLRSHPYAYGSYFDQHEYAYIGVPLISTAFTFGLPFAAIGSYMSARLRSAKD